MLKCNYIEPINRFLSLLNILWLWYVAVDILCVHFQYIHSQIIKLSHFTALPLACYIYNINRYPLMILPHFPRDNRNISSRVVGQFIIAQTRVFFHFFNKFYVISNVNRFNILSTGSYFLAIFTKVADDRCNVTERVQSRAILIATVALLVREEFYS